jgi:hypothetical protein
MILRRNVLVPKERVLAEVRALDRSPWPGGLSEAGVEVPPSYEIKCVAIRGMEQNGFVLLECTYEG